MKQCGADTCKIELFVKTLRDTNDFNSAFVLSKAPRESIKFVNFTFKIMDSNKHYLQAAIFTFGREDLIPDMFFSLVKDINKKSPDIIFVFKYYLERHIEIDGDHHRHLVLQMTSNLCGAEEYKWMEATEVTIESLKMRIALWDGAYNQIIHRKENNL